MVKKIVIRVFVLSLVVLAMSMVYERWFWKSDLKENGSELLLKLMDLSDSTDVLYLAESSNFTFGADDSLRWPISDFIDEGTDLRVNHLTKGAYHAGLFAELIDRIPENTTIKTVIVTMNLRTLDQAAVHSPLETSLQMQKRMFIKAPALWNRVMLTFNAYDDRTKRERDQQMWREWTYDTLKSDRWDFPAPTIRKWCELPKFVDSTTGEQDMQKRALADHYVKAYAFQIDTNSNPRIADFDRITELCSNKGLDLYFNLLPENTEYADSLVGPELVGLMRENAKLLENRYQQKGVVVINNLELLEGERYTDKHWTTEHYDQKGREAIAQEILKYLK